MRKIYVKPSIEMTATRMEHPLLAGSPGQITSNGQGHETPGIGTGNGGGAKKWGWDDSWDDSDWNSSDWDD